MFDKSVAAAADVMARARLQAHEAGLPASGAYKDQWITAFMERTERELAPTIQAIFGEVCNDPDAPEAIKATIQQVANPTNQIDAVIGFITTFLGIMSISGEIAQVRVEEYVQKWKTELHPYPLTPAEVALASIRGEMDDGDAESEALRSGLSHHRFHVLQAITGEPPAIQELLFLYRRGHIDRGRLERGIRQSRVRNEWIDAVEALRYVPPSPQEAVAAAVQNHLDIEQARTVYAQGGLDPETFDWVYETHGRPPGIMEFGELVNRGLATEAEWTQAIRESDIKNKYIPAILRLREYVPPVRSIIPMLRHGGVTPDRARQLLAANGVTPEDIEMYVREATNTAAQTHKELSEAQVLAAYRDRIIDRPTATARLVALTLSDADAALLLDMKDAEAEAQLVGQVLSTTRSRYVSHHVDDATASASLDRAGVPAAQRDHLLALWKIQRDETTKTLTPAMLVKGVKNGALELSFATAYMERLGYSTDDVTLWARIEGIAETAA